MKKNENGMDIGTDFTTDWGMYLLITIISAGIIGIFAGSFGGGLIIASLIIALFFLIVGIHHVGITVLLFYLGLIIFLIVKDYLNSQSSNRNYDTKEKQKDIPAVLWFCVILIIIGFIVTMVF